MSDSDDENVLTPVELRETVQNAELDLLPEKSRLRYMKAFDLFNTWRHKKGAKTFSENVILSYFIDLATSMKPSTLWSIFSMLKATLKLKKDVHIEKYPKLLAFLKRASSGHKPKKSKIFTAAHITKFLNEAPDSEHLGTKVVLIIGISGACRTQELTYIKTNNIESHSEKLLLFKLPDTKTNIERNFVVRDEYAEVVKKYQNLRPPKTSTDRFFLGYRKGKCINQPMGPNKIGSLPREIATFLGLASPEQYTGHCFRRTSATLLADSGADLTTLKRHGGWKSSTVAEGYLEDSIENKSKICKGIVSSINLKSHTYTLNQPSTSKVLESEDPWSTPLNIEDIPPDVEIPSAHKNKSKICKGIVSSINLKSHTDTLNQPSTSKVLESEDPWSTPLNIEDIPPDVEIPSAQPISPTFTLEASDNENNLPTNTPCVTNNNISVPKKNLTINLSNCNNITFNF